MDIFDVMWTFIERRLIKQAEGIENTSLGVSICLTLLQRIIHIECMWNEKSFIKTSLSGDLGEKQWHHLGLGCLWIWQLLCGCFPLSSAKWYSRQMLRLLCFVFKLNVAAASLILILIKVFFHLRASFCFFKKSMDNIDDGMSGWSFCN